MRFGRFAKMFMDFAQIDLFKSKLELLKAYNELSTHNHKVLWEFGFLYMYFLLASFFTLIFTDKNGCTTAYFLTVNTQSSMTKKLSFWKKKNNS